MSYEAHNDRAIVTSSSGRNAMVVGFDAKVWLVVWVVGMMSLMVNGVV